MPSLADVRPVRVYPADTPWPDDPPPMDEDASWGCYRRDAVPTRSQAMARWITTQLDLGAAFCWWEALREWRIVARHVRMVDLADGAFGPGTYWQECAPDAPGATPAWVVLSRFMHIRLPGGVMNDTSTRLVLITREHIEALHNQDYHPEDTEQCRVCDLIAAYDAAAPVAPRDADHISIPRGEAINAIRAIEYADDSQPALDLLRNALAAADHKET